MEFYDSLDKNKLLTFCIMRVQSVVFRLLLVTTSVIAQDSLNVPANTSEPTPVFPKSGYVTIASDSAGLDIFIDGMLAGQIPIKEPIPLSAGKHIITYLQPDYLNLLEYYYSGEERDEFVNKAVQTVYIVPNETINVVLWWRPYEKQLKQRKAVIWIKSLVGVSILTVILTLNFSG